MDSFEEQVYNAERQPFQGWDFSYLHGRYDEGKPGWDFHEIVLERSRNVMSLLDLGTGGGEFLSSLGRLPETACATEGYRPNTKVALANLRSSGVAVVETWCEDNGTEAQAGALPFRNETFDIVIDRHESYVPGEVLRVLKRRGRFITQQVGSGNNSELRLLFKSAERHTYRNLSEAKDELEAAGFVVLECGESSVKSRFLDVGALVYYLKAIPWEVPGFSVSRFGRELREAHSMILRHGSVDVTTARFYVVVSKV